jgi:hypothetical protein
LLTGDGEYRTILQNVRHIKLQNGRKEKAMNIVWDSERAG